MDSGSTVATPAAYSISFRVASSADCDAMGTCRVTDPSASRADERMSAYFDGQHHPQHALMPRTGYIALNGDVLIGYCAGHLTTRYGCSGEVQYLFVAPAYRRQGIATGLLQLLAAWFREHAAVKVCVNVDLESPAAEPFYQSLGASPLSPDRRYWYVWEDIGVLAQRHEI